VQYPDEHLPPVEAHLGDGVGVVGGEPVVEFPRRAGEPAPVHRAEEDLSLQFTEEQQVLEDVGGGQQPVDTGSTQRPDRVLEDYASIGHGPRIVTDTEDASGRMVD